MAEDNITSDNLILKLNEIKKTFEKKIFESSTVSLTIINKEYKEYKEYLKNTNNTSPSSPKSSSSSSLKISKEATNEFNNDKTYLFKNLLLHDIDEKTLFGCFNNQKVLKQPNKDDKVNLTTSEKEKMLEIITFIYKADKQFISDYTDIIPKSSPKSPKSPQSSPKSPKSPQSSPKSPKSPQQSSPAKIPSDEEKNMFKLLNDIISNTNVDDDHDDNDDYTHIFLHYNIKNLNSEFFLVFNYKIYMINNFEKKKTLNHHIFCQYVKIYILYRLVFYSLKICNNLKNIDKKYDDLIIDYLTKLK